jgi:hypothetical protein
MRLFNGSLLGASEARMKVILVVPQTVRKPRRECPERYLGKISE